METISLMTVGILLAMCGIATVTSVQREPRPPVTLVPTRWQQFADSCVGTFVARSVVVRPMTLALAITNTMGGIDMAPEEQVDHIGIGQSLRFTLYETRCRDIVTWRVWEQSRRLADDPVRVEAPMEY